MEYHEVQRFSARLLGLVWLFILLLASAIIILAPDQSRGSVFLLPVASIPALGLFFLVFKLRTEVRAGMLSVRLAPLPALNVPLEEIRSVEVIQYKPLRDFGGWGWRFGNKGTVYSASGNQAVRLEVDSRRPIFIGSAKPHDLAAALKSANAGANS